MSRPDPQHQDLYGLICEFDDSHQLVEAARKVREAGYTRIDAHVPFPIHGLSEALGIKRTILPWIVLLGGLAGCAGGFYLQYWISAVDYPVNAGGSAFNSWPAFIPVTFECTILGAALAVIIGMLTLNQLPQPYHPVFNAPNIEKATEDHFFLCIEAADPQFDPQRTRELLQGFNPLQVSEVQS